MSMANCPAGVPDHALPMNCRTLFGRMHSVKSSCALTSSITPVFFSFLWTNDAFSEALQGFIKENPVLSGD